MNKTESAFQAGYKAAVSMHSVFEFDACCQEEMEEAFDIWKGENEPVVEDGRAEAEPKCHCWGSSGQFHHGKCPLVNKPPAA